MGNVKEVPFLMGFLKKSNSSILIKYYKYYVLIVTFFCYMMFHASRKPITIVKAELHQNCTSIDPTNKGHHNTSNWCDWKPFDQDNYKILFSQLDYAYLFSYAISMFFSGFIAERMSLRIFLFLGTFMSGSMTILFGLGYILKIHIFSYYMLVQILNGIVQATGWPGVVALVGNWFGQGKRGLIMGVWNSHTSFGNIVGSFISAEFVTSDWALSFIVPGLGIILIGIVILLTIVPFPQGLTNYEIIDQNEEDEANSLIAEDTLTSPETEGILSSIGHEHNENTAQPISFFRAFKIPGVLEFSFCLFFAKLVCYTFLYWLPYYLSNVFKMDAKMSGNYSTIFDFGGIIGGILAGALSDVTGKKAITCGVLLLLGAGFLSIFQTLSNLGTSYMILTLFSTGLVINGPYALITTAISADLGTHECLMGNSQALATVTAIIDGIGSIGAALGPFMVGIVAGDQNNWSNVFIMLLICDVLALLCLSGLISKEIT